jgi:membrane fusion protein (multidrug efflux system)
MQRYSSLIIMMVVLLATLVYVFINHFIIDKKSKVKAPYTTQVTAEVVVASQIQEIIEALGTTASNEAVALSAVVTAKIYAIHFEDGAMVKQGDVLVELDAVQPRADAEEKRVKLTEEERQLRHLQTLIDRKAVSQTDVEKQQSLVNGARAQFEAAQARLQDYTIRAPFSGHLGVRRVSVGALVSPGTVITTLDDVSRIKVDFSVPETLLPFLKLDLPVQAYSEAYADKVFNGVVTFVDNRIDPVTRAVTLRAHLQNEQEQLRPGMLLSVHLQKPVHDALMIPERSVAPLRGEQFLFVIDADNKAHKHSVKLGARQQGRVEVLSGIAAGDVLVVDGGMSLQDGMEVTVQASPLVGK